MRKMTRHILVVTSLIFLMTDLTHANEYVDHNDGTITDKSSKTMWQKSDDGVERVWEEAVQYCESLNLAGYSDWILPKVHQLETLIDAGYSPTIDPVFNVKPSYYWSASSSRHSAKSAKYINFYYGNTYAYSKDNTYYVICTRDATVEKSATVLQSSFSFIQGDNAAPLLVSFSPEIVGGVEPYFYEWDFGDGNNSNLADPVHVYNQAGTFRVALTLSDDQGMVAVAQHDITVPKSLAAVKEESIVQEMQAENTGPVSPDESSSEDISPIVTTEPKDLQRTSLQIEDTIVEPLVDSAKKTDLASLANATLSTDEIHSKQGESDILDKDQSVSVNYQEALQQAQKTIGKADSLTESIAADKSLQDIQGFNTDLPSITGGQSELHIFASTTQKPLDNKTLGHGLLAYSFVNALNGDADWNKDGEVTAHELKGYLSIAVDNLSGGKQSPVITLHGDDYSLCSDKHSTYVFAVGVDQGQDGAVSSEFAARNAEAVRKAVEGKCLQTKTSILTGNRASRSEVLHALKTIRRMILPQDNLVFYFSGGSETVRDQLNLFLYDTNIDMSSFTGVIFDDVANYLRDMKVENLTILLETPSSHP